MIIRPLGGQFIALEGKAPGARTLRSNLCSLDTDHDWTLMVDGLEALLLELYAAGLLDDIPQDRLRDAVAGALAAMADH